MKRLAVAGLLAVGAFAAPATARASCAGPPADVPTAVAQADVAFVGTVVDVANRGRWATFAIQEVWKGDLADDRLEVRAGPADPGNGTFTASSGERRFTDGSRYLVFPSIGSKDMWGNLGGWVDNSCSPTRLYEAGMAMFRPAGARIVAQRADDSTDARVAEAADDDDAPVALLLVGLALLAAAGGTAVVVAFRRRPASR